MNEKRQEGAEVELEVSLRADQDTHDQRRMTTTNESDP